VDAWANFFLGELGAAAALAGQALVRRNDAAGAYALAAGVL